MKNKNITEISSLKSFCCLFLEKLNNRHLAKLFRYAQKKIMLCKEKECLGNSAGNTK